MQVDGMSMEEMRQTMRKYNLKSPVMGNELSDPMEFNLMFTTSIGPSGAIKGWVSWFTWWFCFIINILIS